MSISETHGSSDPPTRRGCSTRIKPDACSSRSVSSGIRRVFSASDARSLSFGASARTLASACSLVMTGAEPALGSAAKDKSANCFGRRRVFLLRRFRGGEVELDHDAVGILQEHLMQPQRGDAALEIFELGTFAALDHALASGDRECDVIE